MDKADDKTIITPAPAEEIPDTSKFKGRVPRAVIEKKRALEPVKKPASEIRKAISQKNYSAFLEAFIQNGGNSTKAIMQVTGETDRKRASALGSYYLKQTRDMARIYMEAKGASYGALLDLAIDKAQGAKSPEWWDRLMKLAGYADFMAKQTPAVNVNIQGVQKDLAKEYIIEGEIELPEEDIDGN